MRITRAISTMALLVAASLFGSASELPRVGPPTIHQKAALKASDNNGNSFFGTSVAVRGDVIVVGAENQGADNQGAAYVFVKSGNSWEQVAELTASDALAEEFVGYSVAISSDGNTIFAGAPALNATQNTGAVYVFVKPATGWTNMTETAKLSYANTLYLGAYLSISSDGSTVAAGGGGTAAYIFVEPAGGWASMTKPTSTLHDPAGEGVAWHDPAISGDGSIVTDGSVQANSEIGAVFVYLRPGSQWQGSLRPTAKLTPSDGGKGEYGDEFGSAVATDGNIVVVGATNQNSLKGEAYVYVKPTGGWTNMTETARIMPPEKGLVQPSDFFGFPVVISGKTVLIGYEGAITDVNNEQVLSGDVFGYVEPAEGWKSTNVPSFSLLPNPLLSNNFQVFLFGNGIAVDGKTVVVGAPGTAYKINCGVLCRIGFPGVSYVFDLK